VPLGGKTAACLGVPQVATRLQFFFPRTHSFVSGRSASACPSRTQGKAPRKRPVRVEALFRHEVGTGHEILATHT
jgi:hypothetical protein